MIAWGTLILLSAGVFRGAAFVALGLALYTTIPLLAFGLWTFLCRRKAMLGFGAGAAAVLSLFVVVNLTTYGSPLPPYYAAQRLGNTPHLLEALAGNLISPGRGLLLFSPVLGLAVVGVILKLRTRTLDGIDFVLAGSVVAHWLAISSFPRWWGGDAFGPRFFADMVPFLVVLSLPVVAALATAAPAPIQERVNDDCLVVKHGCLPTTNPGMAVPGS